MSGANQLNAIIAQAMEAQWAYGIHDCTQFAIDCEMALTGRTTFPEFLRSYKSKTEGMVRLKELGFRNSWDFVSSRLDEISLKMVKRGDWVGHLAPGKSLGIAANEYQFWAAHEKGGIVLQPIELASKAWRLIDGR